MAEAIQEWIPPMTSLIEAYVKGETYQAQDAQNNLGSEAIVPSLNFSYL